MLHNYVLFHCPLCTCVSHPLPVMYDIVCFNCVIIDYLDIVMYYTHTNVYFYDHCIELYSIINQINISQMVYTVIDNTKSTMNRDWMNLQLMRVQMLLHVAVFNNLLVFIRNPANQQRARDDVHTWLPYTEWLWSNYWMPEVRIRWPCVGHIVSHTSRLYMAATSAPHHTHHSQAIQQFLNTSHVIRQLQKNYVTDTESKWGIHPCLKSRH